MKRTERERTEEEVGVGSQSALTARYSGVEDLHRSMRNARRSFLLFFNPTFTTGDQLSERSASRQNVVVAISFGFFLFVVEGLQIGGDRCCRVFDDRRGLWFQTSPEERKWRSATGGLRTMSRVTAIKIAAAVSASVGCSLVVVVRVVAGGKRRVVGCRGRI